MFILPNRHTKDPTKRKNPHSEAKWNPFLQLMRYQKCWTEDFNLFWKHWKSSPMKEVDGGGWHHKISTPYRMLSTNSRWLLSPTSKRGAKQEGCHQRQKQTIVVYDGLCVWHSFQPNATPHEPANTRQTIDCTEIVFKNQLPSNRSMLWKAKSQTRHERLWMRQRHVSTQIIQV